MFNSNNLGLLQPRKVLLRHILSSIIISIPVAEVLFLGKNNNVESEFLHSFPNVIFQNPHLFLSLDSFLFED